YGSAHSWKLSSMVPGLLPDPEAKEKAEEKQENPSTTPGEVALRGDDSAEHAGVETGKARRQALSQYVEAPAVLAFDQTRYAHLAPRVNGTAWRVLRQMGDSVGRGDVLALVAAPEVGKLKA